MPARVTRPDLNDPTLEAGWRRFASASPFLSWDWTGCLVAQRFPDPVLVEAEGGMALFNRRAGRLYLNESGDPTLDSVFIEHNGALGGDGALPAILAAVRTEADRVVLSGIGDAGLKAVYAAGGIVVGHQTRAAPYAVLDPAVPHITRLSRNTRAQLRRSDRSYAEAGPVRAERAASVEQALDWLDRLVALHRSTWEGRGIASGFLGERVQHFHRALIHRGIGGTIDLMRISAGPRVVGYLLNLGGGGRVCTYQSGLDYADAGPHEKPGLTCHHAAIEWARAQGAVEYDFLAGDSRYKRSLATASRNLHWLVWKPRPALFGIEGLFRRLVGR